MADSTAPELLQDISTNLVDICDELINTANKNSKQNNEAEGVYSTNGRIYKKVDEGNFVRVKNQQKHLIISDNYTDFKRNLSIISSYSILSQCGSILQDQKRLCLIIIFTSREIELNKWYESNTKITTLRNSVYNPLDLEEEALNYINDVPSEDRLDYVELGCNILAATKVNFLQTDHHVMSPTLEGFALRELITKICGYEALKNKDVYNALRAYCHWCSIRGILHSLDVKGLKIDNQLLHSFESFPEQPAWLKETVFARMPAGTSKVSFIFNALENITESIYGKLIPVPSHIDIAGFYDLCNDIQADPLRYHVRASSSNLSINPPLELAVVFPNISHILDFVSTILLSAQNGRIGGGLLQSSRLHKLNKYNERPTLDKMHKVNKKLHELRRRRLRNDQLVQALGGEVADSVCRVVYRSVAE